MSAGLITLPRADVPAATRTRASTAAVLTAITAIAAGLRLASFAHVPPNPFYDAAVRSMAQSWHNFFYGAFEPAAGVSIVRLTVPRAGLVKLMVAWTLERALDVIAGAPASDCGRSR